MSPEEPSVGSCMGTRVLAAPWPSSGKGPSTLWIPKSFWILSFRGEVEQTIYKLHTNHKTEHRFTFFILDELILKTKLSLIFEITA